MLALDDYEKLKRQVESLEKEREQSVGVLNELLKDMQQKHGCKTLKELKKKLEVMKKKEQAAAKEYFSAKKKFVKTWKHVLEAEDE
jgi:hypothetical protein